MADAAVGDGARSAFSSRSCFRTMSRQRRGSAHGADRNRYVRSASLRSCSSSSRSKSSGPWIIHIGGLVASFTCSR